MKSYTFIKIIPIAIAVIALGALACWFLAPVQVQNLVARIPGADRVGALSSAPPAVLTGVLKKGNGIPADLPGLWSHFRGEQFDAVSTETTPLAKSWASGGPAQLWAINLGEGYAGAAVRNGRVYVLDYDQAAKTDVLRCLSLADGKEIWSRSYPMEVKRNHGMSRTVPAVTDKYVITLGPKCHVVCLDAVTGDFRWGIDLQRQFGTRVPPWYAGQCPLIDGDKAIIAPSGSALMIAVDCATGKVLWQAPNPEDWPMSHSSIIPMTFNGKKMYVYTPVGGVVGVSADDGKILWKTDEWKISISTIPTPVVVGDGRLFLAGGYSAGSIMLRLKAVGDQISVSTDFRVKQDVFGSDQQTPVFYKGYIYGVIPGGQLACLDLQGRQVWTSGNLHRFGLGPYMIADGMIYVMNDNGLLTLVEATPSGYHQLAEAKVLEGPDAWGPFALAGGRLLARDLTRMVCLDVK
ncbi:MAG: PQQ-binding-like beta-propeller repeat protein [Armatimonadota bacterium]